MDSLEERDSREDVGKYRKAAFKAWKTIRSQKRESAAKRARTIQEFIDARTISAIQHPETAINTKERKYERGIISQFSKTPENIVCGRFWELRWAFGCPLDCAYCYLRGTKKGKMQPSLVNLDTVFNELDKVFSDPNFNDGKATIFNSGELSDSLMKPSFMARIVDKFEEQDKHKILLLSKFGMKSIGFLLERTRKNTICAWSINATEVAKRWERAAPSPSERIQAAKKVSEKGYEVRVRIDPMFPIENWKQHYTDLVYSILSEFEPKRIVLGTPRGLWKTIKYARLVGVDMSWAQYFDDVETGWGKKLPLHLRKEMYQFMFDKLVSIGYRKESISICKETTALWDSMRLPYKKLTCQCYSN